jgi:hypothetical protein
MLSKLLNHPIIAGLVVAAIVGAASTLFGWWAAIWEAMKATALLLVSDVSVPLWLIASTVGISLVAGAILLYSRLLVRARTWREYREDTFYGLRWRWNYFSGGAPHDPVPYCLTCDFEINPGFASAYSAVDRWEFKCENCGKVGATIYEPLSEFEGRVKRQIELKVRNGSWKDAVSN